jgi:hypothetical protein
MKAIHRTMYLVRLRLAPRSLACKTLPMSKLRNPRRTFTTSLYLIESREAERKLAEERRNKKNRAEPQRQDAIVTANTPRPT